MSGFALHPRLAADTLVVGELALSRVLLMNDPRFPWLLLVPRRPGLVDFLQLDGEDCSALLAEARRCGQALTELFRPTRLNIGALGNVVPQFHLHVVARFEGDARWPQPVWGAPPAAPYEEAAAAARIKTLRGALQLPE
jgi:diadenosine tetraphosphate (Ap4A) HIT family hydrolase